MVMEKEENPPSPQSYKTRLERDGHSFQSGYVHVPRSSTTTIIQPIDVPNQRTTDQTIIAMSHFIAGIFALEFIGKYPPRKVAQFHTERAHQKKGGKNKCSKYTQTKYERVRPNEDNISNHKIRDRESETERESVPKTAKGVTRKTAVCTFCIHQTQTPRVDTRGKTVPFLPTETRCTKQAIAGTKTGTHRTKKRTAHSQLGGSQSVDGASNITPRKRNEFINMVLHKNQAASQKKGNRMSFTRFEFL